MAKTKNFTYRKPGEAEKVLAKIIRNTLRVGGFTKEKLKAALDQYCEKAQEGADVEIKPILEKLMWVATNSPAPGWYEFMFLMEVLDYEVDLTVGDRNSKSKAAAQERLPFSKLDRKIEWLGLPTRIQSALMNGNDIVYVGQLVRLTEYHVRKLRFIGPISREQIEKVLKERDLSFGMDVGQWKHTAAPTAY